MFNVDKKERDYHIIFFSFKSDFLSFIQWDRYMEKKKRIKIIMRIKWGLNGVYLTSSIILNFLMVLTEK